MRPYLAADFSSNDCGRLADLMLCTVVALAA